MQRLAASVLLLVGSAAAASEPERIGFGMRSPGMGGTGTATSTDHEATYLNPGGLGLATARELTVGFVVARYRLTLDGKVRDVDGTAGLLIGATVPIPLRGVMARRLTLGLGFYIPFGVINRAKAPYPDQPSLALLESSTQTVSILLAGAVRITDWLSVGGGTLALAALVGGIALRADGAGHIGSQAEEQLVTDFAPLFGVRLDPHRRLHLGVVFRGRSVSRYDIRIDGNLGNAVPLTLPKFKISGTSQFDPLQVAVEGAVEVGAGTLIALQAVYKRWSEFPLPSENATLGAPPQPPTGFHDTVVPRLGLEWKRRLGPVDLALRGGYFFEWSPTPTPRPESTLLDPSRHVLSLGSAVAFRNRYAPVHVELFFQWHQSQPGGRSGGFFGAGGLTLGAEL